MKKLKKFVAFTINFTDAYHEAREEKWLFRMLGEHGMPINFSPLSNLIDEHQHFRNDIKCISEHLNRAKVGDENYINKIKENLVDYFNTIKGHMNVENNIVYNAAERLLTKSEMHLLEMELKEFNKTSLADKECEKFKKLASEIAGTSIN